MPRQRAASGASSSSSRSAPEDQELGSMYDYLAKIILLGPSGCGKSCLLHRFVRGECTFTPEMKMKMKMKLEIEMEIEIEKKKPLLMNYTGRVLSSQTIGVEFSSKIIKVGTGSRRKRIKLQLWDTAGQERFRSVTRSYYRGAAGAVLVYDITSHASFASLPTFLTDARALASPNLTLLLVGNKSDLSSPPPGGGGGGGGGGGSAADSHSTLVDLDTDLDAAPIPAERAVSTTEAARWADHQDIPVAMETSALSGEGVDEIFSRLAGIIVTRIELGEVDPDDPMSGIQYGDGGGWVDAGARRKSKVRTGLGEWGDVFREPGRKKKGCC